MVENLELERSKAKKKIKNEPPIDRNNLNPRLPDEIVHKLFKLRLNENICKNRGYILDGYPRNYNDAKGVFMDIDETKQEDDLSRFVLNKEIFPNHFIKLGEASDEFLKTRIKQNPEIQMTATHYNEEGMNRRLLAYKNANESIKGDLSVSDFFSKNDIDILGLDCKIDLGEIINKTKIFVERVIFIYIYSYYIVWIYQ
jgi:adenylate kinase family enzyme